MKLLRHNHIRLALHELRGGSGRTLLLLHGLGERSPDELPDAMAAWNGPIFALDFTGHGQSTIPAGGAYTAEILMGDADVALAELGPVTVLGRGLGAYVTLLLAGARPKGVRGAILCDGPGLAGGGPRPGSVHVSSEIPKEPGPPDPFALAELAQDVRPPDYATSFARQATHLSGTARPITVCARERPDWLTAVLSEPGVGTTSLEEALRFYGSVDE